MSANENALTPDQLFEIRRQARLELARRYAKEKDILNWGAVLFPEKFNLPFCDELHGYFVQIRGEERTNTEAPRNHAKTTIKCFLIPLFQALEEPETFRHYLNVQATATKAISINVAIKSELENNEDLRELYGDHVGDKWTEKQFVLKNGIVFTAIGAGESIRGINHLNIRPDYLLIDDLYDEDDINNPDSTEKKNRWFWGSLYPARAKSKRCSIHFQGTSINKEDLLEKLKGSARWISKTFQAITDWDAKTVLWEALNSFDSLMQDLSDMGSVIFHREMQNERRDEESSIIKDPWWKEYEPSDLVFDEHFRLIDVILLVDPSIGKDKEADYTGIAVMLIAQYEDASGYEYFIDELHNEHLSMDQRVRKLQSIIDARTGERRIRRARIEGVAGFKDFTSEARRRLNVTVEEIDQVKDKITNLENKSRHFENGKVHVSKRIDPKLRNMLKHQLTTNYPKNDDVRDAVLLGLPDLSQRRPTITVFGTEEDDD